MCDGQIVTGDMIVEKVQVVVWKEELGYNFDEYIFLFFSSNFITFVYTSINIQSSRYHVQYADQEINVTIQNNHLVLPQYENK